MNKIEWLKDYREQTGCDLRSALRAWDHMAARMAEDTSLRDAAALAALQGFCSQTDSSGTWSWLPDMAAAEAWRVADAFIAARETKEGKE
jgi:hypothetical protein